MKQKLIRTNDWQKLILSNSQTSFSTISPVQQINGPFIAYAWAGVGSMASGATIPWGTIIGCRIDPKDQKVLNLNNWLIKSTGTVSLLAIEDVADKSKILDHWTDGVPAIFNSASQSIKDLILSQQNNIKAKKK